MKLIMLINVKMPTISSGSTLFAKVKKILHKNTVLFESNKLTPIDMYNGLSQVYCIEPEGRLH